jgi:hypothetical protein
MSALPEPQQAFDTLFQNVHANVFFTKLAQFGYQPVNEKEASDLLELAGKLRAAEQAAQIKQASSPDSPIAAANRDLDRVLAQQGLDAGVKQASAQEHNVAISQAAAQLSADPAIYNAVLSIKAAEAEQVAEALNLRNTQA